MASMGEGKKIDKAIAEKYPVENGGKLVRVGNYNYKNTANVAV